MTEENKIVIKKLVCSILVIAFFVFIVYLIFKALGWTEIEREQLQEFIQSTGAVAPLVFILVSFAQVTLVPIPGIVTILAGNYIFGLWLSFLYSYIGMLIGAIVAFFMGRVIGRPYVNWIAGSKQKVDDWIKKLKGRENIFLFFAFLLPLFPDDILCSVAGILPISFLTFFAMQVVTRLTSIGSTLVLMSGKFIPYEGWGLVVIALINLLAIVLLVVSIKYADKINKWFSDLIDRILKKHKKVKNKK